MDPPYDVIVGTGALAAAAGVLDGRRRVAIVSQAAVAEHHASTLADTLTESEMFLMGDGEDAKTLATVEDLARRMARWGLLRDDAIVALGGGVVGDVAGFTAATYHRGVTLVQAPTTLLAMVDAAIGGKTAVNLPEGKNLLGAFHQPAAVLADVATLETLPAREYRSGLGEVAKYALMGDGVAGAAGIRDLLRRHREALAARDTDILADLVARCAAIKAAVVAADPVERTGLRATLNYGHTLAHALETDGTYALTHGEAVAVGLVFALRLAECLERLDTDAVDRSLALIESLGLPTGAPVSAGVDPAVLVELMRRDKKARGGLTFVLDGPNGLERVDDPPAATVERALAAVGVGPPTGMGD
ncbi:MAG TPA: 3-dehydroquinate synthase [Acidimicrobiia bacterium]|nr:3-dehydroquinate synthase [Acidimicrobiia bacterium]